jgi:hypothetical protein
MAALKTTDRGVQYAVTDAHGNKATVQQGGPTFVGGNPTVMFTQGGHTITLTKQNVVDLLTPLTGFSSSGVLS